MLKITWQEPYTAGTFQECSPIFGKPVGENKKPCCVTEKTFALDSWHTMSLQDTDTSCLAQFW